MADDVWTALVKGALAFARSRVGEMTADTFKGTEELVSSLVHGAPTVNGVVGGIDLEARLDALKTDVKNLGDKGQELIAVVQPKVNQAGDAVQEMAAELATTPFTAEAASRAGVELGKVFKALDEALDAVAEKVAEPSDDEKTREDIKKAIKGIKEPWVKPIREAAASATAGFDTICAQLGIEEASKKLKDSLTWDDKDKKITADLYGIKDKQFPPLMFDGIKLKAFLSFKGDAYLGLKLEGTLKAGLKNDGLLEKIVPGQPTPAEAKNAVVTLDTKNGVKFGDQNKKITLPVRFTFPGVELREFALALPIEEDKKRDGRLDITMTVAAKIGDVVGAVAEGGGVTLIMPKEGQPGGMKVEPRPPDGVGLRVDASVLKGGGFLQRKDKEFGGVLELKFTKVGITAIGLLGTDPFSLVIVIGVRFEPKVELGMGFTMSAAGGLLAIERRLNSQELREGFKSGAADALLFPENPVASAPQLLSRIANIFPYQEKGFVIGPMMKFGWGSQAGFLNATVGVIISVPDPKVVLLGKLEVGVPSTELPDKLRIVNLKADIYGEFAADYLLLLVGLKESKLSGIPVTGDIGVYIRWAGASAFALSVGGFFPKYKAPAELSNLKRITVDLSPKNTPLKIVADGYFAVTANSLQFGGSVRLEAKLSVAEAKAWLSLDALFQWSPRFYFIVMLDVGIEVKAFGKSVAGVSFKGELEGTTPWRVQGRATVEILWWDVAVEIGPHTWGEVDVSTGVELSPRAIVAKELAADSAWTTLLPPRADSLARLTYDDATPLLVHPLGALEVRQQKVPLEIQLDRIGSASVKEKRIHLSDPKIGGADAGAVANAFDDFAPGHFLKLTRDEQVSRPDFEKFVSGMQVTASKDPVYGTDAAPDSAAASVPYAWETVFPHESFEKSNHQLKFVNLSRHALRLNAVSMANRLNANPYAPPSPADPVLAEAISLKDDGLVSIHRREDATIPAGLAGVMTTTEAIQLMQDHSAHADKLFTTVAAGVAP